MPIGWLYDLPQIFFSLFYHNLAGLYDGITMAFSMGLFKEWLATTLTYVEGNRVLELGHGPGHLQQMIAQNGGQNGSSVFGLDESHQMIAQAQQRLRKAGCNPGLVRGIGQVIPFGGGTFDHVVTSFPSEFITHPDTLSEVQRVLRPGGQLIVLRFAWPTARRWPYKMTAWLFRLVGEAPGVDGTLPEERLSAPFREAGFKVQIDKIDLETSDVVVIRCMT
jgi:ubiquinone/menaquinone biosynthesis C-methylase UbiE